jgi:hypothetical protein
MQCSDCHSAIPANAEKCPTCGKYLGPPNVREVQQPEEKEALQKRYEEALKCVEGRGAPDHGIRFEEATKKSSAVINVNLDYLKHLFTRDKSLYSAYSQQVDAGIRKLANPADDRRRKAVEGLIFGSYGKDIIYAALSLDGAGLSSYASYALRLRSVAVSKRATLLECNSYDFVEKHTLTPDSAFPLGYRSVWNDRHKLALAKLHDRIEAANDDTDFAKMLLFTEGKRVTDDFIEVHVYGGFDRYAVETVRGSFKKAPKNQRSYAKMVKALIEKTGVEVVEI